MAKASLRPEYFERIYAETPDPWDFSTSAYEAEKYAATLDMLGSQLYGRGLEIGCSIGVFTEMLAARCRELVSVDVNERALAAAAERCASLPNVRLERMIVPAEMPEGTFDLVVISEVGYYWSDDDIELAKARIVAAARPDATLELVHFLPDVSDYVRSGDAVHELFLRDERFVPVRATRAERYRIDVLRVR